MRGPKRRRRSRLRSRQAALLACVLAAAGAFEVAAQLSPGTLARPHAQLEGTAHCLECHESGKGVDRDLCLGCHIPLRQRIREGRGLHAREDYRACERCHIEHQGADFELVWWGEEEQGGFDHRQAGYVLEGRHAAAECRACHKAGQIADPEPLLAQGKNLDRTFLGLGTACLACHTDLHRGQLGTEKCLDCHDLSGWKPVSGFDHRRSRYPLTGRHRDVACARCHPGVTPADGGAAFVRYRGLAFRSCRDCHRDIHEGRLGTRCATCHTTRSWGSRELTDFEHDRTRYPLRGLHRRAECRRCHVESLVRRLAGFDRCTGCHADYHRGQLLARADGGACDSCHSVDGFRPARFSLDEHERTDYPLEGAHRAVPCVACHRSIAPGELAEPRRDAPQENPWVRGPPSGETPPTWLLQFARTRCRDCHDDPHHGDLDRYAGEQGCTSCHRLDGWKAVTFDHSRSRYPLTGRHQGPACLSCHPVSATPDGEERMQLSRRPLTCEGCHEDPHRGQLRRPGEGSSCNRCHSVEGWKPVRFDHDRDSIYRLDGAHRRVACLGCHPRELVDGRPMVRYRPLPSACIDCHRTGAPLRNE